MRSACWSMMRWNARSSARSSARAGRSSVAVTPLMEMSGARSSWLTMARNFARRRSVSSSAARSCIVTTTVSASPPAVGMGVALTSMRTLRPSGTESSTSAARRRSALFSSSSVTSRPSASREVSTSRKLSSDPSGPSSPARMRFASRLTVSGLPVAASSTTTPTGEVSTSASKSARARRSSRCARALAMATAACAASSTSTSSSSSVNAAAARLLAEEEVPDVEAVVAHRRALEGAAGDEPGCQAERGDVLAEVGEAKRPVESAQVFEQAHRVGPGRHLPRLLGGEAGGDVALRQARLVDGGDDAQARPGERAGAVDHLAQHGVEVEARADAEHRRAQVRDGRARRLGVRVPAVGFGHRSPSGAAARDAAATKNDDSGLLSSYLHDFTRSFHAYRVNLRLCSCSLVRAPRGGGIDRFPPEGQAPVEEPGRRVGGAAGAEPRAGVAPVS